MLKKSLAAIPAFTAGDETRLKEVLHPKNDPVDLAYSLAHAELEPGRQSLPHRLLGRSEVYYILSGTGEAYAGGERVLLVPGDVVLIPAGVEQYVVNTGREMLRFLCLVSPPWREEEERVE